MEKKRSLLNVGVAVGFKIILLIGSVLVRRVLILYLGDEMNGLDSLYISIVGFLSVAELGIGSAIIFCMYKPIVDGDTAKVAALYHLIEKLYRIIGGVVMALGLCVMPFLPTLAKDYSINVNELYITYGLMLISVSVTYMFSAKIALLEAYKNNYIATTITSLARIVQDVLQIAVVLIFRSFYAYMACRIIASLVQWVLSDVFTKKPYGEVFALKEKVDKETGSYVARNVRAMFMHKLGIILVNTADGVIISAFIGVVILGKYNNYVTIMTSMTQHLILFFTPITSMIGHEFAKNNKETLVRYFNFFHAFNFALGVIFFLGYYAIIDDLIILFFGAARQMPKVISFIITYNYFIQFLRNAVVMFRDASGTFYYDRWKSLIEGVLNVILSIALVLLFPAEYKVVGVIVATIITNLTVSHVIEPYMLFKHGIGQSVRPYYLKNYLWVIVFGVALVGLDRIMLSFENRLAELFVNGIIAVGIGLLILALLFAFEKDFRYYTKKLLKRS